MKKVFFIILVVFLAQHSFAQKIVKEEHREMIVKIVYGMNSEIFNSTARKFRTAVYNPEDYFSNTLLNEEVDACFKLMNQTAKLEFRDERIYFVANILTTLNNESIDVSKQKNGLFYGNDTLVIKDFQGGGNNIGSDYYQITRNYPLNGQQTDTTKIHGSLVMKVEFLTDYNTVLLTRKDIGKKNTLGDETIEIVDIIDNAIVLKGNTEKVNVINFIADNQVAKPLTLLDDGFSMENSFTFASVTIYKSNYENIVLKKMSFEEFDKLMTIDKLNEMQHEEQYRVIKNVAKIGEKFILYQPVYKTYFLTVNYNQKK